MDISWYGQSCFKLKGKNASIVVDPYDPETVGLKKLKVSGDILAITHQHEDHNNKDAVEGDPFIIEGAGEYEVKGITIHGIQSFHDAKEGKERGLNLVYTIELDGVNVCHLGDLGHELTTAQLELIGDVDILLIPVGGVYTIDAAEAVKVIAQIEPHVIIPMHYKVSDSSKLGTLEEFLKVFGKGKVEPVSKYSVSKDKLPEGEEVVVLEM
ncbi:MAG: MBL fold metallo-hydrolase [bacterium]|nr:MBL fold metallo-hydrolase [bacterium]